MKTNTPRTADHLEGGLPLVRVIRGLQQQLHSFLSSCDTATNPELTGMIIAVERLAWQAYAAQNVLAAEANHRSANLPTTETISHQYGCSSVYEYLQRCTLMSRREAGARIKLGRSLRTERSLTGAPIDADLPYLAVATRLGMISPENTKMIANMLSGIPWVKADKRQLAERALVEAATGIDFATGTLDDIRKREEEAGVPNLLETLAEQGLLDPLDTPNTDSAADSDDTEGDSVDGDDADQRGVFPALAQHADSLRVMTKTWEQYLDQDGTLPSEKETLNARGLDFGPPRRGLVRVTGNLLPEVAAVLDGLIGAINSPRTQKQSTPSAQPSGGLLDPNHAGGADAHQENQETPAAASGSWSGRDADGRTPSHKRHDALAAIINMASTAAEMPNHGGAPVTVLVETSQEALETGGASWMMGPGSDTSLLTPQAVGHAACSGSFQYYAKNSAGRLVALGNKQRIFNAHQRRAIIARDGGCVIPGCTTPPAWPEIHHVHPHSEGGGTHTDNGVAMCLYHHRTLDTNGWEIRMRQGTPEIRAPRWIDPHQKWRKPAPPTKPPTHQPLSRWARPATAPTKQATTKPPPAPPPNKPRANKPRNPERPPKSPAT